MISVVPPKIVVTNVSVAPLPPGRQNLRAEAPLTHSGDTNRYHLQYRMPLSPGGPMTGPYHYSRAEEILAEIEATPALSDETETALAILALRD